MKKFKTRKTLMRGVTDKQIVASFQELANRVEQLRQAVRWCLKELKHPALSGEVRTEGGLIVPPGVESPPDVSGVVSGE